MVSDIVLLKELPDAIKNSVEAYIGCLSGAMMKDDYLRAIKAAGFRKVDIVDQTTFPFEYMANDPTAIAILKDVNLSLDKVKESLSSVLSIKVSAVKP